MFSSCAALIILPPVLAYFLAGRPIAFNFATLAGFNLKGGVQVFPEFAAMVFGLVTYTAGFIAEIVRAGILAVSHGQHEAAAALGLKRGQAMNLIVVPQALRLIVPPLTSQCLNIVKNSSLAVFIGYPDLVLIFAGTVLNQTHAAVQVMAITMGVYLVISLVISLRAQHLQRALCPERALMSEGSSDRLRAQNFGAGGAAAAVFARRAGVAAAPISSRRGFPARSPSCSSRLGSI